MSTVSGRIHANGVVALVTRFEENRKAYFTPEFLPPSVVALAGRHTIERDAQQQSDQIMAVKGHRCTAKCSPWEPIQSVGDTLVVEKPNGRADVFRLEKLDRSDGEWQAVRDGDVDVSDVRTAWEIARTNFGATGYRVWYRLASESDALIRPYQPN